MKFFITSIFVCLVLMANAQFPNGNGGAKKPDIKGKLYGKVVDDGNNRPLEFAVVRVFRASADSANLTFPELITGAFTGANGDFILENIPAGVPCNVVFELMGFDSLTVKTILVVKGMASAEKDMGNIRMKISSSLLNEVVVEGNEGAYRLEFDKRVYDVDKNPVNAGGTAEDVLRNVPSLQVDLDGNVNLRGGSPQVLVDGRPTTLSIDQIPADAIQRVEVITNPSAKYDASGGSGGIVNIVMKHNRATGYSGSIRGGVDSRYRYNSGLDVSLREGKLNFFINGNYNQRKSITDSETERWNLDTEPQTMFTQKGISESIGYFARGNFGIDFFADNRNTFTLSQSLHRGQFHPLDDIFTRTDTLAYDATAFATYNRHSDTKRNFENTGSSFLYKHLFAKEGTELTADANFNTINSQFLGTYQNDYGNNNISLQKQEGESSQWVATSQSDFTTLINEKTKWELGVRGSARHYESLFENFSRDTTGEFILIPSLDVNYQYLDQVYALYSTYSKDYDAWKLQAGLRLESSNYQGELRDTTVTFTTRYPLSIFPSVYITKVLSDKQDIQLALTRRVSRPGFMQLIPFTDYADSLNVSRGNPELLPEFTHLAELSYQYSEGKKFTVIASAYFRYISDLTIRHQITEYSEVLSGDVVVNTYANASSSQATGLELVARTAFSKWLEVNANFNLYQSTIDGSNVSPGLESDRTSWWAKLNLVNRLPKNYTIQISADYQSSKALEVGSGERGGMGGSGGGMGGGHGGGGFGGGSNNTIQGYIEPSYSMDIALKKDFGKSKNLSASVSVSDVFKTRISDTHSESEFFIQNTLRKRDQQVFRFNMSWKFGKLDTSVFRRKNTRSSGGEGDMGG